MNKTIILRSVAVVLLLLAGVLSVAGLTGWDPAPQGYMVEKSDGISWLQFSTVPFTGNLYAASWEVVVVGPEGIAEASGPVSGSKSGNIVNFTMHRSTGDLIAYGELAGNSLFVSDYSDARVDIIRLEYVKSTRDQFNTARDAFLKSH